MNCKEYSILMTDRLAGEITPEQDKMLQEHLDSCPGCKKEFEELTEVWELTEQTLTSETFVESLTPGQKQDISGPFHSGELKEDAVKKIKPADKSEAKVKPIPKPAKLKSRRNIKFVWMEIAASIIVLLVLGNVLIPEVRDKFRAMFSGIYATLGSEEGACDSCVDEVKLECNMIKPESLDKSAQPISPEKKDKIPVRTLPSLSPKTSKKKGGIDSCSGGATTAGMKKEAQSPAIADLSAPPKTSKTDKNWGRLMATPKELLPKKSDRNSSPACMDMRISEPKKQEIRGLPDFSITPLKPASKRSAAKPVAVDAGKNHSKFSNVLYLDGHVNGIAKSSWWTESGKITEARKKDSYNYKDTDGFDEADRKAAKKPSSIHSCFGKSPPRLTKSAPEKKRDGVILSYEVRQNDSRTLNTMNDDLSILKKRYKDDNPKIVRLKKDIASVKKNIALKNESLRRNKELSELRKQRKKLIRMIVANKKVKSCETTKTEAVSPKEETADIARKEPNISKVEEKLAELNKKEEALAKQIRTAEKQKQKEISKGLAESEKLYKEKKYDQARDEAEKVLIKDPFNFKAINVLRKINLEYKKAGKSKANSTFTERIAEEQWKCITPIEPRTLTKTTKSIMTPVDKGCKSKLDTIMIDRIEFEEVTVPQAINFLKKRSKELDPEGKGVKIFSRLAKYEKGHTPTVTMVVSDISLSDAIRYICRTANLRYRVEKHAVVIASQDIPMSDVETQIYKVDAKLWNLTTQKDIIAYLKTKGISFDENKHYIKVKYNKKIDRIVITTEPDVQKKIKAIFKHLNSETKRLKDLKKGLPFIKTDLKPVSTFSIDVDTASYTQARKQIRDGHRPVSFDVRPEEFINYFDYHYRQPRRGTFGVELTAAPNPFRPDDYELRIGVQGKKLGPKANQRTSFTILVDVSGSMAEKYRMSLVKEAINLMLKQLNPTDRISVIACGEAPVTIHGKVPPDALKMINTDGRLEPKGEANLEKGVVSAYKMAMRNFIPGGYNRVIVFTDGIVKIDSKSAEDILKKIDDARKQGITNTIVGVGGDGNDKLLETLADKGDGNYVFLDNSAEVKEIFGSQFAAKFREIARDVKIQAEFNKKAVNQYRQVGYDNRQLSKADFRNDSVDAGEVGAGQSVTALYELKLSPDLPKDTVIATVRIRYKQAKSLKVEEEEFALTAGELKKNFAKAPANFKLATLVGEFAEFLRYPEVQGIATPTAIAEKLREISAGTFRLDPKVRELLSLIMAVK